MVFTRGRQLLLVCLIVLWTIGDSVSVEHHVLHRYSAPRVMSASILSSSPRPSAVYSQHACTTCAQFEFTDDEARDFLPSEEPNDNDDATEFPSAENLILAELASTMFVRGQAPEADPILSCQCQFIPLKDAGALAPAPAPAPKNKTSTPTPIKKPATPSAKFVSTRSDDSAAATAASAASQSNEHKTLMQYDPDYYGQQATPETYNREEEEMDHQLMQGNSFLQYNGRRV